MTADEPTWEIAEVPPGGADGHLGALVRLLRDAVAGGASIGWVAPPTDAEAAGYWRDVLAECAAGGRVLLVARAGGEVVGTAQLALSWKPSADHRAEVQKVLVGPRWRGRGLGRALMAAAEAAARARGRTLLVLDVRKGDVAERLYAATGYTAFGEVPGYARSTDGVPEACVFYFKRL